METVNISMAIVNATSMRSRIQTTHVMFLSRKLIIDREERKKKETIRVCVYMYIYFLTESATKEGRDPKQATSVTN